MLNSASVSHPLQLVVQEQVKTVDKGRDKTVDSGRG